MKPLLFCALVFPFPGAAKDLWCTPDRICVADDCSTQVTEGSEIRLKNPDSVAPSLVRHGEVISMTKIMERNGRSIWDSTASMGDRVTLDVVLIRKEMSFIYQVDGSVVKVRASGQCEVR